ncbi:MAG: hypothetical protein HYY84_02350 [Deltaproteobacteria bacterium]|nr:hypothetical protein [Deltaproteobacteria bacterium]
MKLFRLLFVATALGCAVIPSLRAPWGLVLIWERTVQVRRWFLDAERAPIWQPPKLPSVDEFKRRFGASDFPDKSTPRVVVAHDLRTGLFIIELLVPLWLAASLFGVAYRFFFVRRGMQDQILHCAMWVGLMLTGAAGASGLLFIFYGGTPAVFLGVSGLVAGVALGIGTFKTGLDGGAPKRTGNQPA